jgi:cyanophycinase
MRFASLVCVLLAAQLQAAPYPPELGPGPLVIVGGGKMPEAARTEFIRLAGGEKAKIIVIPTASLGDDEKAFEAVLKPWKESKIESAALLHTRDRKVADGAEFAKPFADATGIWFDGGDQHRLVEAYLGTATEKAMHALHKRGGVIGGTSAGAAVMSETMIASGNPEAKLEPGFGFLPGIVIDQHFTERKRLPRLAGAIEKNPEWAGLGIDEGTALILTQGRFFKIVGDGGVTTVLASSPTKASFAESQKSGAIDLFQIRRAAHFRAMKEQFPAAKPAEPNVPKGSLLIVGGGGAGPEIWKTFIELAGGPNSTIVVVSTANEDPVPADPGEAKALRAYGAKKVKILHTRDRQESDSEKFTAILKEAKGVWFTGGRHWRFVDSYEGTLSEKRFREVLDRGGVIGGSSAGASIQAEYMPRGHPLGNMVVAAEGYERGFGYLPGCAVDQHFFARKRTADMTGLMKQYPQLLGIGIDEGTAIVVKGSTAEVIGKSKVGFYDARTKPEEGEKDYAEVPSGGKYDLAKRKALD